LKEYIEAEDQRVREWRGRFIWLDPAEISLSGDELHWKKIDPAMVDRSFALLGRMKDYLNAVMPEDDASVRRARGKLAELRDSAGARLFSEEDLRIYDLYFGTDRIRVELVRGSYAVVNGRHRLLRAQGQGLHELPVFLVEPAQRMDSVSIATEVGGMEGKELEELDREAREQHSEIEKMHRETDEHRKRVDDLERMVREMKDTEKLVHSETSDRIVSELERGKEAEEKRLQEMRDRKEELTRQNRENLELLKRTQEQRKQKWTEIERVRAGMNVPERTKHALSVALQALREELRQIEECTVKWEEAGQKLERLDI
jgi:hypothetical protein